MSIRGKNSLIILLFIFAGLVIGSLLGEIAGQVNSLIWLSYGQSFGITTPLVLDLNVFTLTFAFSIHINIASIIGIAISLFLYKTIL